jgi:acyl-CoA thioester hydrolase
LNQEYRFGCPIEVRSRDIDTWGHVNSAVYFSYMEQARIRYMQHLGLAPDRLAKAPFIIAQAACQYKAPVPYGMPLVIRVRVTEMRTSSFLMDYSIEDENTGRVTPALAAQVSVATGRSVNVAYDYAAGQSIPIPPEWRAKIEAFERGPSSEFPRVPQN